LRLSFSVFTSSAGAATSVFAAEGVLLVPVCGTGVLVPDAGAASGSARRAGTAGFAAAGGVGALALGADAAAGSARGAGAAGLAAACGVGGVVLGAGAETGSSCEGAGAGGWTAGSGVPGCVATTGGWEAGASGVTRAQQPAVTSTSRTAAQPTYIDGYLHQNRKTDPNSTP
jgi:hypothetical protein